jgi:hypothetical protein
MCTNRPIETQKETDFTGYIRQEAEGLYSNEIYHWGVNHGKIYGATAEEVKRVARQQHEDS